MKDKKLLIIDGYGFIFRAYHVQPPLHSPSGQPVGALYGFTSMLLKVLNDFKPQHAVMVFDAPGKNFRHKIYKEYKAHRPPVPEDLIPQLGLARLAASSLNFQILEKEGFEADDIIATLALKATKLQEEVIIISSDKDLMQLINDYIKMYDPVKNKFIKQEEVIEKFGVGPDRVREIMALIGDKSDNVPGVPSIGPKTAAELISQFGSIDGIYNSIDQIKSARLQAVLQDHKEAAYISWQLIGLDQQVDIDLDIESSRWHPPSQEQISDFLTEHGFKSLYKRAESLFNLKITEKVKTDLFYDESIKNNNIPVTEIDTPENLKNFIREARREGKLSIYPIFHKGELLAFCLGSESKVVIIKSEGFGPSTDLFNYNNKKDGLWFLHILAPYLEFSDLKKITYNIKYLFHIFKGKAQIKGAEDIKLMEYLLTAGQPAKDLFEVASSHIRSEDVIEDSVKISSTFFESFNSLQIELKDNNLLNLYQNIDLKLSYVLDKMEQDGVKIDAGYLGHLSKEFSGEIAQIEEEVFAAAGIRFNIGSPKQLGEILFDKMQLPLGKLSGKSKSYGTGAEVLENLSELGFPIADQLLKWRQLTKLKNTYTDSLPLQINKLTGRVHTTLLQTSTTTGRLSSIEPNLQNIPIRSKEGSSIRAAFIAEEGNKLISADYSQIELRILADIAGVAALKEAFMSGGDIHVATACKIFHLTPQEVTADHRRKAKTINFGIIYGQSSFGLAKQIGSTNKEAAEYIKQYFKQYPEIEEYMNQTKLYAKEHGFVKNIFGRRCHVPYINEKNFTLRQFAERAAINAPIQGTSADIIKLAMINLDKKIIEGELKAKMVLQIHDELLFEIPETEVENSLPIIKKQMETAVHLSLPLIVEARAGNNWAEIH